MSRPRAWGRAAASCPGPRKAHPPYGCERRGAPRDPEGRSLPSAGRLGESSDVCSVTAPVEGVPLGLWFANTSPVRPQRNCVEKPRTDSRPSGKEGIRGSGDGRYFGERGQR